jgi:hypothetical protein
MRNDFLAKLTVVRLGRELFAGDKLTRHFGGFVE